MADAVSHAVTEAQNRSDKENAVSTDPIDATVIPFTRARRQPGRGRPHAPAAAPLSIPEADPGAALFGAPPMAPQGFASLDPEPAIPTRKAADPERVRANALAKVYTRRRPLSKFTAVSGIVHKAIREDDWDDDEIAAALGRLADEAWDVTARTLRIELRKGRKPERQIDPVIHQAVDAALGHLNQLDSEQMTETERGLAAALRQICVAVMHKAVDA